VPAAQQGTWRRTWPGLTKETDCIVPSSSCSAPLGSARKIGTLPGGAAAVSAMRVR